MRRRLHITWQIGPYIHRPFHSGLPTLRDWCRLLAGLGIMAFAFKQYIAIGEQYGWLAALSALASEAFKEIKEYWNP